MSLKFMKERNCELLIPVLNKVVENQTLSTHLFAALIFTKGHYILSKKLIIAIFQHCSSFSRLLIWGRKSNLNYLEFFNLELFISASSLAVKL